MPLLEPPDPQPIGDTMTEKRMEELEARINELNEQVRSLRLRVRELEEEEASFLKLAQAISELQDEVAKANPDIMLINRLHIPTKVGY